MTHGYERSLLVVLRHRFATLMVLFGLLGGTVWLFFDMPKGFLPSTDSGVLNGIAVAGQDISFDSMVNHVWAVKNILEHDPNVRSVFANVSGGNQGQIYMMLKPRDQRALSADQVMQELQPKILGIPGIQAFLQNPPPINIGSNNTQSPYQLTLQGADQHEIYRWVPILLDRIRTLARLHERHQRFADRKPADHAGHQSRSGADFGRDAGPDPECSFHRLRYHGRYPPSTRHRTNTR